MSQRERTETEKDNAEAVYVVNPIDDNLIEIKNEVTDIATNTAQLKFNKVAAVIEDTAITQANLIGFAITTTGTCVFVDADNNEMDLSSFQEGFYAGLPAKFKTGLTATVVALYFE